MRPCWYVPCLTYIAFVCASQGLVADVSQGATFSLIAFAAVIIATRFFYRLRIQREMLVTSDWFMILALCAAISCAAFDVVFYSLDVLRPRISVGFENYNPGEEKVEYIYKVRFVQTCRPR